MKNKGNDWVYDIEFYKNFFCVNFRKFPEGDKKVTFEISNRANQREELLEFLRQDGLRLIGYNNVGYDYPVLHELIRNPDIALYDWWKRIQNSIFSGERRDIIWPSDRKVFQIDLFKINHYDNQARSTSLKWLEFTQRWYKVQDLPIKPQEDVPNSMMDLMISYCWNDVDFTFEFAESCWGAVEFRENMSEELGRNVMDYSDVKIGEYLNQLKYLKLTGKNWKDIKDARTQRRVFKLADIIPDVIEFHTPEMKAWLEQIRQEQFVDGEEYMYDIIIAGDRFDRMVKYGVPVKGKMMDKEQKKLNCIVRFAKGGLHSVDMPRVVKRKEGWTLKEKDVGSMYPRSIVVGGIYPLHLGEEWNQSINEAYHHRLDVLKPQLKTLEKGSPEWKKVNDEQALYKLAMNGGGFGKLGSAYSWQYDPLAKYRVTIGCELKLLMLIEQFVMNGIDVVSVNTDGVVVHYPNEKKEVVERIHKEWEAKTDFLLEDTDYRQIVFASVNDYIAEIVDPETDETLYNKYKGDFEIDKDPHKNNSQRIVAIALSEYFMNGVKLHDVIGKLGYEFTNSKGKNEAVTIYDYCIGRKTTKSCYYLEVDKGKSKVIPDKVIRYYISRGKKFLLKHYTRGKKAGEYEKVNKGWNAQLFMDYFPPAAVSVDRDGKGDYLIDKRYYLNECLKVIEPIEKGTRWLDQGRVEQTQLFD